MFDFGWVQDIIYGLKI